MRIPEKLTHDTLCNIRHTELSIISLTNPHPTKTGQCPTHITAAVHIPELVQMRFDGLQVLLLHVAEQALDSQGGHLQGGGGIHG